MSRMLFVALIGLVLGLPLSAAAQEATNPVTLAEVALEDRLSPSEAATFCDPDCIPGQEVVPYVDTRLVVHNDGVIVATDKKYVDFAIPEGFSAVLYAPRTFTIVPSSSPFRIYMGDYIRAIIFRGELPLELRQPSNYLDMLDPELCNETCSEYVMAATGLFIPASYDLADSTLVNSSNCETYPIDEGMLVIFPVGNGQWIPSQGPLSLQGKCQRVWIFYPVI